MSTFDFAVSATRGARSYQEDSAGYWAAPHVVDRNAAPVAPPRLGDDLIAVLADGMGGHTGGAVASRLVCEQFLSVASQHDGAAQDRLIAALQAANGAVADKVATNPMLSGMGSTLIGATFGGGGIEWVSVGDSPLFLYRRGDIIVLNEDHSLAPELDRLVAAGQISPEEARRDPRRHMLRSAVTGEDIELVDVSDQAVALEPGDYVVLASDGIASLETGEIARIISGYAADGASAVAEALIRSVDALKEPHQDNATVLVVRPL